MRIKIHSTLFYFNVKSLYAYAQFQATKGFWGSHVSDYVFTDPTFNLDWEHEAALTISSNPVNLDDPKIEIWECTLSEKSLTKASKEIIIKSRGWLYAILQILYFARRYIYEELPFIYKIRRFILRSTPENPRDINNWFPRSFTCTELKMEKIKWAAKYDGAIDLFDTLNSMNLNNLTVKDVYGIHQQYKGKYFIRIKEVIMKKKWVFDFKSFLIGMITLAGIYALIDWLFITGGLI